MDRVGRLKQESAPQELQYVIVEKVWPQTPRRSWWVPQDPVAVVPRKDIPERERERQRVRKGEGVMRHRKIARQADELAANWLHTVVVSFWRCKCGSVAGGGRSA